MNNVETIAPPRALVVDDDEAIARLHARALTLSGYQVQTAPNGVKAMEQCANQSFDVILSDVDMPEMNGLRLLEGVRTRDHDVPFVLITGRPDIETTINAIEHGALRYLVKPVELSTLVKVADDAVRLHRTAKAKRRALDLATIAGRQLVEFSDLTTNFTRAIANMYLDFQPIVSWSDKAIVAYEALLRTKDAGLPNPGAMIHAAEKLDRLPELGRRIRAQAAEALERMSADTFLFVNLHPLDLLDDELLSPDAPLSKVAHRVVLEITERASLEGVPQHASRVAAVRKLGYSLAIDDLGAGYAGLTSFATLEPDIVKLDMSLIRAIHKEPTKKMLVRTMVAMCRELGIIVIAEGVETVEERDELARCGCDWMQGYLFARPGNPFPGATF